MDNQLVCELLQDWDHMLSLHIRVTGERWIHSSPDYETVVYAISDWQMSATRRHVRKQNMTVSIGQDTWHNCEVTFAEWCVQMPNLIMELKEPIKLKQHNALPGHLDRWIYLGVPYGYPLQDYAHLMSGFAVGDVDQFKEMITYYKIMFDWNGANGARL